ncbi:terpene synthase family protein [Streptacidiphilus fuscans]|uniref:Terpene synthase n=1 Tax=Streptacidiphilus fuscans TaxID=2789292 RepID=A0A931B705_9ACTN|nr:hypothetical protein [Streptacidiphilus fuscans]MBF9071398.1 hypothetical protein [Streptacidiphilus fuscans]
MSSATAPTVTAVTPPVLDLMLPHGRLLPSRTHPGADAVRQEHDAWFRQALSGLQLPGSERLFGPCEGVSLMCRVLPDADAERLVGICVAASALFLLDDVADDEAVERARADDYLAVLRDAAPSTSSAPLLLLARTLTRARQGVAPKVWARFVSGFSEVITAGAGKSGTATAIDGYAAYLAVRRADSAIDLVGVAIEHGLGLDLDLTARQAAALPAWEEFHDACFRHTILVNDLLSFRKEHFGGEPMNAVTVLCEQEGLPLQQAVDAVCVRIAGAEEDFLASARALRELGTPELDAYLTAWELMLSGNLVWSLGCPRYHGADARPWPSGVPTRMELHRDRTVFS